MFGGLRVLFYCICDSLLCCTLMLFKLCLRIVSFFGCCTILFVGVGFVALGCLLVVGVWFIDYYR